MDWFTSDLHLGHANIIEHCNRPFDGVERMNEAIVGNINRVVKPEDRLYVVGDFCWKSKRIGYWRQRILCRNVVLLLGNHDAHTPSGLPTERLREHFSDVQQMLRLRPVIEGQRQHIVMCHYPLASWQGSARGAWHLHGHTHGNLPANGLLRLDVGVDCHGFEPMALWRVVELLDTRLPA